MPLFFEYCPVHVNYNAATLTKTISWFHLNAAECTNKTFFDIQRLAYKEGYVIVESSMDVLSFYDYSHSNLWYYC